MQHAADFPHQRRIFHRHQMHALQIAARGRGQAGLQNLLQMLPGHRVGQIHPPIAMPVQNRLYQFHVYSPSNNRMVFMFTASRAKVICKRSFWAIPFRRAMRRLPMVVP